MINLDPLKYGVVPGSNSQPLDHKSESLLIALLGLALLLVINSLHAW